MSGRRGKAVYQDPRWKVARRIVLERARWCVCEKCGRIDELEVHHLDEVKSRHGAPVDADFDVRRLQAICRPCHWEETAQANRRRETPQEAAWRSFRDELA